MSGDGAHGRLNRRQVLSAATAATVGLAGCPDFRPDERTGTEPQREQQNQESVSLADCRSPRVAVVDFGSIQGVGSSDLSLFGDEIAAALEQINTALGTTLEFVGTVSVSPQPVQDRIVDGGGLASSELRDLTAAVADGLALNEGFDDNIEPGMSVVVPHNLPTGEADAAITPARWKYRDEAAAHRRENGWYFCTTMGAVSLMDVGFADITVGRELEAWQAVGRLLGASPFDGGYNVEERDGRRVITDITPMATRHTFGRYGARDHRHRSLDEPAIVANTVEYDTERGETVRKIGREGLRIPVRGPDFLSERETRVPADAEHIYGSPSEATERHRFGWGRGNPDPEKGPVMARNHVKRYTDRALTAMGRALGNDPASFDASRPPTPGTRCGKRCEVLDGAVVDTFEDGAALPEARDGSGSGLSWTRATEGEPNFGLPEENRVIELSGETTPNGDSSVLRLAGPFALQWQKQYKGWDCPWTLTGRFHTRELPGSGTHDVSVLETNERRITLGMGLTGEGSEGRLSVSVPGGTPEATATPEWIQGVWYDYELLHDGAGRYEGRVWKVSNRRPGEPMAVTTGETFTGKAKVRLALEGSGTGPTLDHARFSWNVTVAGEETPSPSPTPTETPSETIAGQWPQRLADAQNTGYSPTSGASGSLENLWSFNADEYYDELFGRHYSAVTDGDLLYVCTEYGPLIALRPDGTPAWRFSEPRAPNGVAPTGLAVGDDWVYMTMAETTTPAVDEQPAIYAVDKDDGSAAWRYRFPELEFGGRYTSVGQPTLVDGTLFALAPSEYTAGDRSPGESPLIALDAETGALRWRVQVTGVAGNNGFAPAVTDTAVVLNTSGALHAYDRMSGDNQWTVGVNGTSRVMIAEDTAIVLGSPPESEESGLLAYDVRAGNRTDPSEQLRWQTFTDDPAAELDQFTVDPDGGVAYLTETDSLAPDRLHEIDITNEGSVVTSYTHDSVGAGGDGIVCPVCTEDVVYFGDPLGTLTGIDRETGETRFAVEHDGMSHYPLAIGDQLYTTGEILRAWQVG